jgi:hypothetical protein
LPPPTDYLGSLAAPFGGASRSGSRHGGWRANILSSIAASSNLKHCVHAQRLHGHRSANRQSTKKRPKPRLSPRSFRPLILIPTGCCRPRWQLAVATTKRRTAHFDSDAEFESSRLSQPYLHSNRAFGFETRQLGRLAFAERSGWAPRVTSIYPQTTTECQHREEPYGPEAEQQTSNCQLRGSLSASLGNSYAPSRHTIWDYRQWAEEDLRSVESPLSSGDASFRSLDHFGNAGRSSTFSALRETGHENQSYTSYCTHWALCCVASPCAANTRCRGTCVTRAASHL